MTYKERDDYEHQTPYRKAVLQKQFELNKNPYKVIGNHCSYTDKELELRQLASDNWEKEREKYLQSKMKKESKTVDLVNKIIAGFDIRKSIVEAVSVSVVDKETGQGHAFDIDPWKNGKDYANNTKSLVKSVLEKILDELGADNSYFGDIYKITDKKIILSFLSSDDEDFYENKLSERFKDTTKTIQEKLGDLGVIVGKPYEYTFSWDKETDNPCVYVSYDIREK